jgi:hypothetical protein
VGHFVEIYALVSAHDCCLSFFFFILQSSSHAHYWARSSTNGLFTVLREVDQLAFHNPTACSNFPPWENVYYECRGFAYVRTSQLHDDTFFCRRLQDLWRAFAIESW